MQSLQRSRSLIISILILTAMLLAGCPYGRQAEQDPRISSFESALPAEWTPLTEWKTVNIDGDATEEILLFFRYESGQVGGVIYDFQDGASFAPAPEAQSTPILVAPQQAGINHISYRLLPSFWRGTGQGFLAPPGQSVEFFQVKRPEEELGTKEQGDLPDELIVVGGNTHLSVFWWRNPLTGYGVSQISAPGGLYITDPNWERTSSVLTANGYFPEANSRSFLCRQVTYHRHYPTDPTIWVNDYRPPVYYEPSQQGLAFCPSSAEDRAIGYPKYTFYPEATVLAYLLYLRGDETDQEMEALVSSDRRDDIVQSLGQIEQIHSLTFYTTLDIESSRDVTDPRNLYMQVVVELVPFQDDVTSGSSPSLRRFTFILEHQSPQLHNPELQSDSRSDRWLIRDVVRDPGP